MKGIYNQRPRQPRYSSMWDVQVVLQRLRCWGNNASLSRKQLSLKLVMLMALANARRCSEVYALDIEGMRFRERRVTNSLAELTKTSKPGTNKILSYLVLSLDEDVCPVLTLREYLKRTSKDRKHSKLFLTYTRLYTPVKPC